MKKGPHLTSDWDRSFRDAMDRSFLQIRDRKAQDLYLSFDASGKETGQEL